MERFSLTIAPGGENHHGMELIGKGPDETQGFSYEDLVKLDNHFGKQGYVCEFVDLNDYIDEEVEKACVLIVRKYVNESKKIFEEVSNDEWDKKYFCTRRKKVLNKRARYNLCYVEGKSQEPDYENGKGTIIDLVTKKELYNNYKRVTKDINEVIKFEPYVVEGNYYYNNKTGIGFHGDTERNIVVAFSIGCKTTIKWRWYHKNQQIGIECPIELNDGDMYIMSEKAVGTDWKKSSKYTLRHAAGSEKYIK